jgi:hypothetical protein
VAGDKMNKKRTIALLTILVMYVMGLVTMPLLDIAHQNQEFSAAMKTNPAYAAVLQIEMMYNGVYVMAMYPEEKANGATAWIVFNKDRLLTISEDERSAHVLGVYWSVFNALREIYPEAEYYQVLNGYVAAVNAVDGKNHAIKASSVLTVYPTGVDELIAGGKEDFGGAVDGLIARGMAYFRSLIFYGVPLNSDHIMLRPVGFVYFWDCS